MYAQIRTLTAVTHSDLNIRMIHRYICNVQRPGWSPIQVLTAYILLNFHGERCTKPHRRKSLLYSMAGFKMVINITSLRDTFRICTFLLIIIRTHAPRLLPCVLISLEFHLIDSRDTIPSRY